MMTPGTPVRSTRHTDEARSDVQQLEELVRGRLRGRVHQLRLDVRDDGLVLSGRAPSYHAKQLAQHTLLTATGMRLIANDIEVFRDTDEWHDD